jgi:hypothetical protein
MYKLLKNLFGVEEVQSEYEWIREAIKQGKDVHEIVGMMSRTHFYRHIYKDGPCECGMSTASEPSDHT